EGNISGDRLVEIVDVCLVMAAVVNLHGRGVDGGFEGFLRIGKRREFVCHGSRIVSCWSPQKFNPEARAPWCGQHDSRDRSGLKTGVRRGSSVVRRGSRVAGISIP